MEMNITWLTWGVTIGIIAVLFAFDFALGAIKPHKVGFKEATIWTILYTIAAVVFGVWFTYSYGADLGTEYFTGYIIERSLSLDNVFVFVIIMATLAVPAKQQEKVLTLGIALALVMRAIFIALGAALISAFSIMFLLFGLLLIYTAVQLFRHRNEDPDIENSVIVKSARKVFPVTDDYIGGKVLARLNGRLMVTPLFVVLVSIGGVDLLFALDSIPAVFGVTESAYIVFTVNAFALLGLRPLFFLVEDLLDRLVYLSVGLSAVLLFIGIKLILHWAHIGISHNVPQINIVWGLSIIIGILAIAAIASLIKTRSDPTAKAHAGSLHESASGRHKEQDS